ncbi:MAG: DUF1579 domain-containing protein [Acidobacteria bacterium]|nr:DUF1579 domain-containing protein [Acidobacteriota bacterium]
MHGMPDVTDAHRELGRLEGNWEGQEKMHPSKWLPDGAMAVGRQDWKVDLGSFFLIGNVEQERDGVVTHRGHGVWGYDPDAEVYRMHWFESTGTPPQVFEGNFDGNTLVMADMTSSTKVQLRYEVPDDNSFRTAMLMSDDGETWKPFMEGEYHRT